MSDRRWLLGVIGVLAGCMTGREAVERSGPSLTTIQAEKSIAALEFSVDSRYLVHLDTTGGARFWDVFADKAARDWADRDFGAQSIVVGRDDRFAVANGKAVRVLRLGSGLIAEFETAAAVSFMRFDEMSRTLAVADALGGVIVYDLTANKRLRTLQPEPADQLAMVLPGAGFGIVYIYQDGRIQLTPCAATLPGVSMTLERKPDTPVSVCANGRKIASFDPEGRLEIRSIPTGKLLGSALAVPWEVESMNLSPDGSVLAVANRHVGVWLWDTERNEELDRFDSKVWIERGLGFSRGGNFLAWVERDRKTVRFWSPARGVVQWEKGEPALIEKARSVCGNLAETIRFRRATAPFEDGMKQLDGLHNDAALRAFEQVAQIMPNYPGLQLARAKAEERREAELVRGRLTDAEAQGDYRVALRLLEVFLRDHAKFDDYGFRSRAKVLRDMMQHLDAAEEHRKAGRQVDAVIEFEAATKVVPELETRNTEYVKLRKRLLESLAADAKLAFAQKDYVRVIKNTESLARLRELGGEALIRLGVAHELLGNSTQAEKAYLVVKPGSREYVAARRSIARIARVGGDFSKARRHLELARADVVDDVSLETEYAEVCQLCKDYDAAVAAWRRVGMREQLNPQPFANIATIEEIRENWQAAALALQTAIERSKGPRPKLLVRKAQVLRKAGGREQVIEIYKELLGLSKTQPEQVAFLGLTPRTTVENWIRELDYVYRRKEWIPRSQFLEEQGWEHHDGRWLRPREARLREVAERYRKVKAEELRAFSDERYDSYAKEQRITKGMSRREVIKAWGFFGELTVFKVAEDDLVFEQLNFEHSRKVYLRNGLVCYWSE